MTTDEARAYAWLLANLPTIMVWYVLPASTVLLVVAKVLGALKYWREFRRGARAGIRSNYVNAGLTPPDHI